MKIALVRALKHAQVEFPEGTPCPPGRKAGEALHLRRDVYVDITPEEWAWLGVNRRDIVAAAEFLPDAAPVSKRTARALGSANATPEPVKGSTTKAARAPRAKRK